MIALRPDATTTKPGAVAGAQVLAVHVGKIRDLPFRDRSIRSAAVKEPVRGALDVTTLGLEGDEHGDRAKHGGPDKAVCVFPAEHYPTYESLLGRRLARGAFGENLVTWGLREDNVCIGDLLGIGTSLCEVSLPRSPCFRMGARHGVKQLPLWMEQSGRTGFYLRVMGPGELAGGCGVRLVRRPHAHAAVAEANRVMHRDKRDHAAIEALLALPQLGASWRRTFERRLAGEAEDPTRRRYGP